MQELRAGVGAPQSCTEPLALCASPSSVLASRLRIPPCRRSPLVGASASVFTFQECAWGIGHPHPASESVLIRCPRPLPEVPRTLLPAVS